MAALHDYKKAIVRCSCALLWPHVIGVNACNGYWFFHCVPAEWFTKFLVQHYFDKGCHSILHLRSTAFASASRRSSIEATATPSTPHALAMLAYDTCSSSSVPTKLSSNQMLCSAFGSPLIIAENYHGYGGHSSGQWRTFHSLKYRRHHRQQIPTGKSLRPIFAPMIDGRP